VKGSWVRGEGVRRCIRLLLVQKVILMFVCLKSLVLYVVSLPVYVKVAHL
jgi:hypothetical protein